MTDQELKAFTTHPKRLLIEIIAGDKPTSPRHIAAKLEIERRSGRFTRVMSIIAFITSFLSLVLSSLAYLQPLNDSTSAPPAAMMRQP
jgi:hypothetical protein